MASKKGEKQTIDVKALFAQYSGKQVATREEPQWPGTFTATVVDETKGPLKELADVAKAAGLKFRVVEKSTEGWQVIETTGETEEKTNAKRLTVKIDYPTTMSRTQVIKDITLG